MLTSSDYGAISPISTPKVYRTKMGRDSRTHTAASGSKFDSFTLTTDRQDGRFLDMVGRLSQEVRTATTTGDIAALRQQVAERQYTVDPMSVAARMLFLGEGR